MKTQSMARKIISQVRLRQNISAMSSCFSGKNGDFFTEKEKCSIHTKLPKSISYRNTKNHCTHCCA
jgi:hypothetical protein